MRPAESQNGSMRALGALAFDLTRRVSDSNGIRNLCIAAIGDAVAAFLGEGEAKAFMIRQGTRRRAVVIAIALITLSPASPAFATEPSCGSTLSPSEITSAGISCRLAATTVIEVAEDLDVTVPERGVVASVEIL